MCGCAKNRNVTPSCANPNISQLNSYLDDYNFVISNNLFSEANMTLDYIQSQMDIILDIISNKQSDSNSCFNHDKVPQILTDTNLILTLMIPV